MVPGASRIRDEIETPPTRNHANIRICRPTKRCTCRSALSRPLLLDSGILLERRSYFEWGAQAQYRGAGPAPDRGAISYFELIKRNYQRCYLYSGASYATHRYGSQANARPLDGIQNRPGPAMRNIPGFESITSVNFTGVIEDGNIK